MDASAILLSILVSKAGSGNATQHGYRTCIVLNSDDQPEYIGIAPRVTSAQVKKGDAVWNVYKLEYLNGIAVDIKPSPSNSIMDNYANLDYDE